MTFTYTVVIGSDTQEQADQVMGERLGPDEDYGFEYQILGWGLSSFPQIT
jgi:hypothetical protein